MGCSALQLDCCGVWISGCRCRGKCARLALGASWHNKRMRLRANSDGLLLRAPTLFFLGTISRTHASPSARPCEDLHNVKLIIMMQLMTLPCAGDDVVITLTCKLCSQMRMFENVYLPRTIQGHGATSIQNIQPFTLPCQVCAVCQRSNKGATPRSVAEVVEPTWSFMQVNSI